jgi:1-acyl-sn-glycerol-3-phosphate acyltransferase
MSQMAFVLYFRGRVFGRENVPRTGGVMLACSHQSFFDPISATMALPREGNYMARDSLFTNRMFGRLIDSLNAFPVKRGAGDVGAVKEILRRLKAGKLVTVFPEGTRTRDGWIATINPNSMAIAKKAGAAVVPTVVDGAFEAWPRTQLLPRRGMTYVTYAEAITVEQVQEWPAEQIAETVAQRMKASLERSRRLRRVALAGIVRHGTRHDVSEAL